MDAESLRSLPSVDAVLRTPTGDAAVARYGHAATVAANCAYNCSRPPTGTGSVLLPS